MDLENKKILLTGGAGFLGKHVVSELRERGVNETDITVPRSASHDLRDRAVVDELMSNTDICIHLAALCGGIGLNQAVPYDLFYENLKMGIEVVDSAVKHKIEKLVVIGTICAYPKFTPVPFKEENLWEGYPEETNAPYGIAKKALLVQLQAARHQHRFNGVYLLPVNLYGEYDDFREESSHVIPALIRKFYEAKKNGLPEVVCWGTGSATREFLYVDDAAKGIVRATEYYNGSEPVNLGAGFEISIYDLSYMIQDIVGYRGFVRWDTTKPDGQPRRCLDTTKALEKFGFLALTDFKKGLENTVRWYENNVE